MIYKLSKDNCTYCGQLEGFLKTSNMKKYNDSIIKVHKETDPDKYNELVVIAEKSGAQSLPILMKEDGTVLTAGFNPKQVMVALKQELGG